MEASVFESPPGSPNSDVQDTFDGMASPEMSGATLRDLYAKAWEVSIHGLNSIKLLLMYVLQLHREPLVWTPRGPGAGVGASSWTLTPVSLILPSAHTRNRRASDASDARSSIMGMSPCVFAQRTRGRRDSDAIATDGKQAVQASPETGMVTPSSSLNASASPHLDFEPTSRSRRSGSCTRSHISSTTAVTVSECSTTQELQGLGLSLGGSSYSRPSTPSEVYLADNETRAKAPPATKVAPRLPSGRTLNGTITRQSEEQKMPVDSSKQLKVSCQPIYT
jgi:hypothetical protein